VLARKSVKQRFNPDERVLQLMETFRRMTNDCIRIGLAEHKTSLKSLSLACYPELKRYGVPSAYMLGAISRATGILRNYRKLSKKHHTKEPFCTRPGLTTCYGANTHAGKLRIPGNTEVPLNIYVQRFLSQPGLEMRSVTLTTDSVNISVRKLVEPAECTAMVGIDRNLDNVTLADTEGNVEVYDLRKVTVIKSQCRRAKQRLQRNDVKVRERIFRKYGQLERDRVGWLFHNISANIVLQAKLKRQAIAMEDLKGIRRLYRKGNGQGTHYRSRMNSWPYAELQRQIEYKAEWNGIPVIYVKPYGTSASCSMCGHRMLPEENRRLHCTNCGLSLDRDVNTAKNIVTRGLRFKPVWSASEAMVQEPTRSEVILKVDADQSTWKAANQRTS
jgi:putative transposase